jgi:tetratricopeptide (TPR) repeat protein
MEPTAAMPFVDGGMAEVSEDSPAGETMFDLGEELRQEGRGIYDEDSSDSGPADKYSQDGVFSAFKVVVDQQFDQEDTETHYNLGMAYKEMGLFDDAIAEFQAASRSAARAADCLTLQGICHRDKGDLKSAEETFRKGVALEGLSIEEALSLKYELALLLEGVGSTEEALQFYREVRELNAGFREVGSRIAAITGDEEGTASEELELLELDVEEME